MTRVWSRRLAGPVTVPFPTVASGQILFTVPASHVYVVRQIVVLITTTGSNVTARFGIGTQGLVANRIFRYDLLGPEMLIVDVFLPLVAGEDFRVNALQAEIPSMTVSGQDLDETT